MALGRIYLSKEVRWAQSVSRREMILLKTRHCWVLLDSLYGLDCAKEYIHIHIYLFQLARAGFADYNPDLTHFSLTLLFYLLGCQPWLTSHLCFGFSSLAGYICGKLTQKLSWEVWPIFLFTKMKITFKKPSHKCLFNNSWLLPWD